MTDAPPTPGPKKKAATVLWALLVVVVMVQTAGQGSEIAAPIARQILEAYFGLS